MSCNCKRKLELEEKYGVEESETLYEKTMRFLFKVALFLVLMASLVVVIPIMMVIVFYTFVFAKDKTIILPKFFGKYLRQKNNGKKL